MEVFLLTLFFITVLVLFISGKDDFGRTENKLIIKESGEVKKEINIAPKVEVKRAKGKLTEKQAKEFASGVESGVKTAVKFAKDVKKVVSEKTPTE